MIVRYKEKSKSKGVAKYILWFIILLVLLVIMLAFFYFSGIHVIQQYLKEKLIVP